MGNTIFGNHSIFNMYHRSKNNKLSDKTIITIKEYPNYCKARVIRDTSFLDNNATGVCSIW